jgi:hypothetical protein
MRHIVFVCLLGGMAWCAGVVCTRAQEVYVEERAAPPSRVYVVAGEPTPAPVRIVEAPAPAPQRELVYVEPRAPQRELVYVEPRAPQRELVYVEPRGPQVQIVEHHHAPPPAAVSGSYLRYSAVGFAGGALVGLSVGYLAVSGGVSEPWRPLLLATGIGALSGAGLGLGLAFLDAASDVRPAPGRFVMRDAAYGTLLGGIFGATVGGLVALGTHDAESVLVGASIGGISGFVLGGLVGVLEGRLRGRDRRVAAALQVAPDAAGQHVFAPSLVGRF